jgi:CDP-glucose 4,6-dehydratase
VEGVVMDTNFWRGKRVLLTGHTGFKGSWLSLWLQSLGAEVTGYALAPSTNPSLFEVAHVGKGMRSVIGDVRNLDRLVEVFSEHQPQIIFHMAAQPLVRYSFEHPVETFATNVMGTVNVLEAARHTSGLRVLVNVTSDKCYENREWAWGYREIDPMGGYDPYSSSKGCAELVTSAYRRSYFGVSGADRSGVALASARAGNVIGGGDWAEDRLIPDFMRSIIAARPVIIRNPKAIRPWQHVLEPLRGYLILAERLWTSGSEYAEAWNFGPNDDDAKPVEWIVERLTRLWGEGAQWQIDNRQHPHEANYLKLDISKSRMSLSWTPRWTLDDALVQVVEWYRAWQTGQNMRGICLQQINAYGAAAVA